MADMSYACSLHINRKWCVLLMISSLFSPSMNCSLEAIVPDKTGCVAVELYCRAMTGKADLPRNNCFAAKGEIPSEYHRKHHGKPFVGI